MRMRHEKEKRNGEKRSHFKRVIGAVAKMYVGSLCQKKPELIEVQPVGARNTKADKSYYFNYV